MRKQNARHLEWNGPEYSQQDITAAVVNVAGDHGLFQSGSCVIVCPGCGTTAIEFKRGLPNPLLQFTAICDGCGVRLDPWAAVVVPEGPVETGQLDGLQSIVQQYWEDRFRIGVQDNGLPRTREFSDRVTSLACQWGWDWCVTCPLCERSVESLPRSYLGYHHWSYDDDVGTSLCDHCHDYIHGVQDRIAGNDGDQQVAQQQDHRAKQVGLPSFRELAIIRLGLRHKHVQGDMEPRQIKHRYNIPLPIENIEKLLNEVRHRGPVLAVLTGHGPDPSVGDNGPTG